jgi:hypothetical protein
VRLEVRSIEKSNDLIGNQIRDLPACNIVPQPTTLLRAHHLVSKCHTFIYTIIKTQHSYAIRILQLNINELNKLRT